MAEGGVRFLLLTNNIGIGLPSLHIHIHQESSNAINITKPQGYTFSHLLKSHKPLINAIANVRDFDITPDHISPSTIHLCPTNNPRIYFGASRPRHYCSPRLLDLLHQAVLRPIIQPFWTPLVQSHTALREVVEPRRALSAGNSECVTLPLLIGPSSLHTTPINLSTPTPRARLCRFLNI